MNLPTPLPLSLDQAPRDQDPEWYHTSSTLNITLQSDWNLNWNHGIKDVPINMTYQSVLTYSISAIQDSTSVWPLGITTCFCTTLNWEEGNVHCSGGCGHLST